MLIYMEDGMGKTHENIEINKTKGEKIREYCNQCNSSTNHEVMQSIDVDASQILTQNGDGIEWTDNYQIIKCQGCDLISFRHLNWFSENMQQIGEDEWEDGKTTYLYPERSANIRIEKDFSHLPRLLRRIYSETVNCYNSDSRILCAAGIRAIIEGICSDQKVQDGPVVKQDGTLVLKEDGVTPIRNKSLAGKIDGLHEKGILTKASAEILHEHRFLGNEAIHELHVPTKEVLGLAMDIIEHMLNDLYEIPDKAEYLRKKRTSQVKKTN